MQKLFLIQNWSRNPNSKRKILLQTKQDTVEALPINIDNAGKALCSLVRTVVWQYKLYSVHICLLHVCTVPARQADAEYLGHLHAHSTRQWPHLTAGLKIQT